MFHFDIVQLRVLSGQPFTLGALAGTWTAHDKDDLRFRRFGDKPQMFHIVSDLINNLIKWRWL